jgi:hypothetical protein
MEHSGSNRSRRAPIRTDTKVNHANSSSCRARTRMGRVDGESMSSRHGVTQKYVPSQAEKTSEPKNTTPRLSSGAVRARTTW